MNFSNKADCPLGVGVRFGGANAQNVFLPTKADKREEIGHPHYPDHQICAQEGGRVGYNLE